MFLIWCNLYFSNGNRVLFWLRINLKKNYHKLFECILTEEINYLSVYLILVDFKSRTSFCVKHQYILYSLHQGAIFQDFYILNVFLSLYLCWSEQIEQKACVSNKKNTQNRCWLTTVTLSVKVVHIQKYKSKAWIFCSHLLCELIEIKNRQQSSSWPKTMSIIYGFV